MSATEVIEQIRALPEEERVKVVRFVIEHEVSWIPTEFREAMDDAARGKMVDMERVMAEKSLRRINALPLLGHRKVLGWFLRPEGLERERS